MGGICAGAADLENSSPFHANGSLEEAVCFAQCGRVPASVRNTDYEHRNMLVGAKLIYSGTKSAQWPFQWKKRTCKYV